MAMHFMLCFLTVESASAPPRTFECWMILGLHGMDQFRATWCICACISIAKKGSAFGPLNWVFSGSFCDPLFSKEISILALSLPPFCNFLFSSHISLYFSNAFYFMALVPLCLFSKTESGEDFRSIIPLSSYGKSVPETIYCVTPSKRGRNQEKCQTAAFRLYCISVIQEQANNSTVT